MIEIPSTEELNPITKLVVLIIYLDKVEEDLRGEVDEEALKSLGIEKDMSAVNRKLKKARKQLIGKIGGFSEERIEQIRRVRDIVSEVGLEKAIDKIGEVIDQPRIVREEIVESIIQWEEHAGLRSEDPTSQPIG
jgi:hypothetical protein